MGNIIPFGKRKYQKSDRKVSLCPESVQKVLGTILEVGELLENGELREIAIFWVQADGRCGSTHMLPENPGRLYGAIRRGWRFILEHVAENGVREPGD